MKKRRARRPTQPAAPSKPRWLDPCVALGVAAATVIGFAPAVPHEFLNWDDLENFTVNPHYRGLGWAQLKWMWTTVLLGHYVPVTWMTLGIDYLIWGMNPSGYHLTNVLLHAAAAGVLYLVALRLLRLSMPNAAAASPLALRLGAAFAALVFALHPLRVESVAWATERRDVLSGLFYLVAIWAYLRDAESSQNEGLRRRPWYWLSLGGFVLALLSKAIAITLPLILLVLDVYPLRRLGGGSEGWWSAPARRRWAEKLPFVIASALAAPVTFLAARNAANLVSVADTGLWERLAISVYGLVFYLWKTLVPLNLSPFYPLPRPVVPWSARYLVCGAVIILVTGLGILGRRRWPAALAVWFAYVVTLLPVSGVFQNGPQISADRYSYLPSLWLSLIPGAAAFGLWQVATRPRRGRARRFCLTGAGVLLVTTLALLTWRQLDIWRNSERLWTHALAVEPSSMAYFQLANVRRQQARWAEASEHYRQASLMRPDAADVQMQWGVALAQQGRLGEAIERFTDALRLHPECGACHYNWGNALLANGDVDGAIAHYRDAVRLEPQGAEAYSNWGRALAIQGKWEEAIAKYRQALQIKPLSVPHYNWGNALFAVGDFDGAIAHYREAARLDPDAAEVYNNWGLALARQAKWEEAIVRYRAALGRRPNYPRASANLDDALAEAAKAGKR
jgi:tetratricopeptide (TPR) repeat protein